MLSRPSAVTTLVAAGFILAPPIALLLQQPFYIDIGTRIVIFAIAALSLDLILGYGGMTSFGHAAYLGLGAYSVGILAFYGIANGAVQFAAAILVSSLAALFIGALSVRTTGIYFIMITLAFGQMLYFLAVSLNQFGGDDGMTITGPSDLGPVDLHDSVVLYYVCLVVLLVFYVISVRLVASPFGMVLRGINSNERRITSLGISAFRYKLTAFVISGAMCGTAGALLANHNLFVSPAIMHWSRSGEILIMVVFGGIGTLLGSVLGATVYLVLEDSVSRMTEHWQVFLGPLLIFVVLFGEQGIYGALTRWQRRKRPHDQQT
jgi:branched-chain amino acid transport system permease protein